ncbi:MAG: diacylglycerol kinase family lipid kinase [Clostridiales bacterium]|nr:diacylglycerol kinase family lipid kinase [Clostridiales bacterium]
MRYVFILNPTAGSGFAVSLMERIALKMDEREIPYEILRTACPGDATVIAARCAADPEIKAVVSVGGDGTASEVAAGLAGTGKPMGIIPGGTGNDFIKSAGIPKDPMDAFEFMLDRAASPVDTGEINGEFFLNVCGTGFDVTVLECAEEKKKKHRGLTPYLLGLLQAIRLFEPVSLEISVDGEPYPGEYLICSIANGRYIGGGIPICPAADAADGKLDVVMIRSVPHWRIPFYLPGLMMSRDLKFRITRHVTASEVSISGKGLKFNIDGEIRPMNSAVFRIRPGSLTLIH